MNLIDQCRGLVKPPSPTISSIISISYHMHTNLTLPPRGQTYHSFSLSHKLFWEHIKMILDKVKCLISGNRHPDPGNFRPILESGYLMIKYREGEENKVDIITTGHNKAVSVTVPVQETPTS